MDGTGGLWSVRVREAGGLLASFDLDPALITVANLKVLVEAETGLEPARQRLIARGRVLRDYELLSAHLRTDIRVVTCFNILP